MTDEPQQNNEAPAANQQEGGVPEYPGKRLQEAREASHLSRDEVARNLHLDAQLIAALEENDQDRLPPPAYVCGYLRSYARLLKLPEDEIVDTYNQGRQLETELIPENIEIGVAATKAGNAGKFILLLIIVLVIVAAFIWRDRLPFVGGDRETTAPAAEERSGLPGALQSEPAPTPAQDAGDAGVEQADASASADDSPIESSMRERMLEPSQGAVEETVTQPAEPASDTPSEPLVQPEAEGDATAPSPASSQTGAAAATDAAPEDETASNEHTPMPVQSEQTAPETEVEDSAAGQIQDRSSLRLVYSEPSWTEVRDADGEVLVYRLVRKGSELNLQGQPPFTVLLGYAPGVEVYYEGDAFDTGPFMRDEIAYFVLGQQTAESQ